MDNTELENLNHRLVVLEQAAQMGEELSFAEATFHYADLICRSHYLSGIVKELAHEQEIDKVILYRIFMAGMAKEGFKNARFGNKDEIGLPLFYDKKVEENYGSLHKFMRMLQIEKKRMDIAEKENISIMDIALSEDKEDKEYNLTYDQELLKFRMMHNQILARAIKNKENALDYDSARAVLNVGGNQIKFRKGTEQHQCLTQLFKNPDIKNEEVFFSALAEQMDIGKEYTDKDFHNYFSAINRRVAAETSIKKLFETTNQSVRIAEGYCSENLK